jgi:TPR repeat protein
MAEGGDPLATYLIGFMYSKGMGFELNRTEARRWLEIAAATGHPAGQLELGAFLLDPEFSSAAGDRERGWELVELASQKDYAKANSYLAYGLLTGSYRKVDNARAKALLQKASDAGHPYAIFALGYHFGEKQASMNKLRQLAKGGNLDGDHWLCIFAFNDKDHATAAETCSRAAKANFPNAKARLALLFENGKGVPAASDRATYWAKQALLTPDLEAGYRPRMKELASR